MGFKSASTVKVLLFLVLYVFLAHKANGKTHYHHFVVKPSPHTQLCSTKNILTVNGQFPGPTLHVHRGDKVIIKVHNKGKSNVTLHWHGVRQLRNPWSDGPAYITQCPIRPGKKYTYRIQFTTEEGTLWWHAHLGWARATVHGAIIVYPRRGSHYPFPKPHEEIPIILGEWWEKDIMEVEREINLTGGEPTLSDAYTINGQPGYLFTCSKHRTFTMKVEHGRRYLLRIINAVMNEELFFFIAQHQMTLVGTDGSYNKPLTTDYIMITPGQTMDVLVEANQPAGLYFMAARSYSSAFGAGFDNTTTTAILQYDGTYHPSTPAFPSLPSHNNTQAVTDFTKDLRSPADKDHPIEVPLDIDTHLFYTIAVNLLNCTDKPCKGPFGKRFSSSLNNITFVTPSFDVLRAYYYRINGVFDQDFPSKPLKRFNYTADKLPDNFLTPAFGTKVKILKYNSSVELVLQGTNILASDNHPVHLHGFNFYVVGWGFGNFDPKKDPLRYNLVDPPQQNTVGVPKNGWAAIRFRADNPGVWLMHCHIETHQSWGMETVFIVKNGGSPQAHMLPPPHDLPTC